MNPGLKKEMEATNQQSFERAMQEYERKNKRLGFS